MTNGSATSIRLLRHADTGAGCRGRFIGSTDVPLDAGGREKIVVLARRVAAEKPDRIFCSPLRRARETAEPVAALLGLELEPDPDLREIDFGRWEGMTFEAIRASAPHAVERWARFDPGFAFPGGEAIGDFLARVRRAADRMARCGGASVLAVTHGGVIRSLICHFLGLSPRHYLLFDVRPAWLTAIALHGGKGVLAGMCDPCCGGAT